MKNLLLISCIVALFPFNGNAISFNVEGSAAVEDSMAQTYVGYEDNETCFTCHGGSTYEYVNPDSEKKMRRVMPVNRILSKNAFYNSVHHDFSCTDCHSYDFNTFPHPAELIFEEYPSCIDCHGGDETFAEYHFDEIDKEYKNSIHYKKEGSGFSCWKCHNPHTYVPKARRSESIDRIVKVSNNICLKCHADAEQFSLLTDQEEPDLEKIHSWLPSQALHFSKVRCIECHTKINDTILVAHMVLPKDEAVQRCNDCHSQNSILMTTLYKFRTKQERRTGGFLNGIIIHESYVIGANRNQYLNTLSIIILAVTILFILIHLTFRVIFSKKPKNGT